MTAPRSTGRPHATQASSDAGLSVKAFSDCEGGDSGKSHRDQCDDFSRRSCRGLRRSFGRRLHPCHGHSLAHSGVSVRATTHKRCSATPRTEHNPGALARDSAQTLAHAARTLGLLPVGAFAPLTSNALRSQRLKGTNPCFARPRNCQTSLPSPATAPEKRDWPSHEPLLRRRDLDGSLPRC
jgi:hypothetical protein